MSICTGCGNRTPEANAFCGVCGSRQSGIEPLGSLEGAERRHLTVMFCDLVGSTELASELDPEDWREVVHEYHAACTRVVERYQGHVAQYLGDGLLVYFGYPHAHDDDAERACLAGLGILTAIDELNTELVSRNDPRIDARLAIDTGPVVVSFIGTGTQQERLAVGSTLNAAAHLQHMAPPHTVIVSEATAKLVRGLFVMRPLGLARLKGVSEPVLTHQLLAKRELDDSPLPNRSAIALVGRRSELDLLRERWARVERGQGEAVLVSGEPGIGKSRLVRALRETLATDSFSWLAHRCSSFERRTALFPIIDAIRVGVSWDSDADAARRLARLEQALAWRAIEPDEGVPLLAPLLGLPLPERYARLAPPPGERMEATLEILARWLRAVASSRPVVFLIEDLHWADPVTLRLIEKGARNVDDAPVLMLMTARSHSNLDPELVLRSRSIPLTRLAHRDSRHLVEALAAPRRLPDSLVDRILARADGVPLFAEQLTLAVLEAHQTDAPDQAIPDTLQESLMARLDRLGPRRPLVQLAALIGHEFTADQLAAVAERPVADIAGDLLALVDVGLLHTRGPRPYRRYAFKHVLVQEAAAASLLHRRRNELTERIDRLLKRPPQALDTGNNDASFSKTGTTDSGELRSHS